MNKLSDCNRCDNRNCRKSFKLKSFETQYRTFFINDDRKACAHPYRPLYSSGVKKPFQCPKHAEPKTGFKLAEIAMNHPQSLHDSLSQLPFDVNINRYIR